MNDKFRRFLHNTFPAKGDGKKQILLKTAVLLCAAVFVASACFLIDYGAGYLSDLKAEKDTRDLYRPAASAAAASAASSSAPAVSPSFSKLLQVNPDVKGWITIPGSSIDHVVAQASDNDYYLHRNFYKKADRYGCPFLDYRCTIRPLSRNTIVYGHHQSTFRELDNYKKLSFYKTSPVITFNTLYGNYQWKVFAVFIANTMPSEGPVFYYLKTDFSSDSDFLRYISEVRHRSLLDIPVDVGADDPILTLSTCNYDVKNARLVVMARLVRAGEDVSAADASVNPSPLMPDAWYKTHGGRKPVFPDSVSSSG